MEATTVYAEGNMSEVMSLGDIPDLTDIGVEETTPFENGWYEGVIVGRREFTDNNGNDRVFESSDAPSAKGDSRNIRLQVALKRKSDGREMNISALINYQPNDLSQETIQAVTAQKEKVKASGEQWGTLFRPFMTLTRLGKLQKIAGVRQLQRGTDGALVLTPLFGKTAFFKIAEDDRNAAYKQITDFKETAPKKGVL